MNTIDFIADIAKNKDYYNNGYHLHIYQETEDYIAVTGWYGTEMVPILIFADTFSGRAYSALDLDHFEAATGVKDMPILKEYRTRIWNEVKALLKEQTGIDATEEMRWKSSLEFKKFMYLKRPKKVVRELTDEIISMFGLEVSTAA